MVDIDKLELAKKQVEMALKVEPQLNPDGLLPSLDGSFQSDDLLQVDSIKQFLLCQQWLSLMKYRKTCHTKYTSYTYKHLVEEWADKYVSNGAFIAAVIASKIPYKEISRSTSCYLRISQNSLKPFFAVRWGVPLPERIPRPEHSLLL